MAQRAEGDGFYDRIRKEQNEWHNRGREIREERNRISAAFNEAGADSKALDARMKANIEAFTKHFEEWEKLQEKGSNPPWKELSENLLYANYKKVEELTRDGKLIQLMNEERVPLLGQPAYAGDTKIAKLLIERGADLNMPGGELKEPPIMTAIYKDSDGVFKALAKAGAKLDAKAARALAERYGAEKILGVLDTLDRKAKKALKPPSKPAR